MSDFSQQVRENYNRQRERRRKMQKLQRLSLGLVAVLMFVLVGIYFFMSSRTGATPNEIAARYLGEPFVEHEVLRDAYEDLRNQHADLAMGDLVPLRNDASLGTEAEWYLALAYLQRNEGTTARELLSTIAATEGHPRRVQATRALEELDQIIE